MFGLGGGELLLLGIIALVFIGPKKLPELARGLGKGIREFQKAKSELLNEEGDDLVEQSKPSPSLKDNPKTTDAEQDSKEDIEISPSKSKNS
jgi:sec-independent protein translocase protein TatA